MAVVFINIISVIECFEKRTSENNLEFSRILDLESNYKNVNGVGNSPLLIAGLDGYNMGGTCKP